MVEIINGGSAVFQRSKEIIDPGGQLHLLRHRKVERQQRQLLVRAEFDHMHFIMTTSMLLGTFHTAAVAFVIELAIKLPGVQPVHTEVLVDNDTAANCQV